MLTIGNGLADALFSAVQQRLLGLLFGHPERSFYAKEIVKALQSGTGAVTRELQKLENSGLVSAERIGNQKHYRANVQSPIYQDLRGIVQKTVGLHDPLQQALAPFADRNLDSFRVWVDRQGDRHLSQRHRSYDRQR